MNCTTRKDDIMNKEAILQVKNVSKKYKNEMALENVSFNLTSGKVVGLVGPNGAGKSTIMKIISGLISNYTGQVLLNGEDVRKIRSNKKEIGCLIESPGFYSESTGLENLKFAAKISGNYSKAQIEEYADKLNLTENLKKKAKNYSLGMKQKLGICIALLGKPQVLILDEPTNGLDPSATPAVREIIKYAAQTLGMAVLVSSHILSELEIVCDEIVFIKKGHVLEENSIKEETELPVYVIETDQIKETKEGLKELGFDANVINNHVEVDIKEEELQKVLPKLISKGIFVKGMYRKKENLEEKYNKVMGA